MPGVNKIANTIDELASDEKFDLIICGHVMEHVAQPLDVVKKLISHLSDNGHLFIEVPMEVWKKPPLHREPVTHINFFTPASLHNLLLESGVEVKECKLYPSDTKLFSRFPVVKAIGRKVRSGSKEALVKPDAYKLLEPSVFDRIKLSSRMLAKIPYKAVRRITG